MDQLEVKTNPGSIILGCQFGNHPYPFLMYGSGNEGTDIAIMELMQLAELDPKLAYEASEFVSACLGDAKKKHNIE